MVTLAKNFAEERAANPLKFQKSLELLYIETMKGVFRENGFSLVQVLMGVSISAGLSLVMLKMGQNQAKLQRTANQNSDLGEFTFRMSRFLAKSDVCNKNLEGLPLEINPMDADPSKRVSLDQFSNTDYEGVERVLFRPKSDDPNSQFQPSPTFAPFKRYTHRELRPKQWKSNLS